MVSTQVPSWCVWARQLISHVSPKLGIPVAAPAVLSSCKAQKKAEASIFFINPETYDLMHLLVWCLLVAS
jgi:hypothetical protein